MVGALFLGASAASQPSCRCRFRRRPACPKGHIGQVGQSGNQGMQQHPSGAVSRRAGPGRAAPLPPGRAAAAPLRLSRRSFRSACAATRRSHRVAHYLAVRCLLASARSAMLRLWGVRGSTTLHCTTQPHLVYTCTHAGGHTFRFRARAQGGLPRGLQLGLNYTAGGVKDPPAALQRLSECRWRGVKSGLLTPLRIWGFLFFSFLVGV